MPLPEEEQRAPLQPGSQVTLRAMLAAHDEFQVELVPLPSSADDHCDFMGTCANRVRSDGRLSKVHGVMRWRCCCVASWLHPHGVYWDLTFYFLIAPPGLPLGLAIPGHIKMVF